MLADTYKNTHTYTQRQVLTHLYIFIYTQAYAAYLTFIFFVRERSFLYAWRQNTKLDELFLGNTEKKNICVRVCVCANVRVYVCVYERVRFDVRMCMYASDCPCVVGSVGLRMLLQFHTRKLFMSD